MFSQLLLCSLKASFALTLLYVPYTFLLRKENFFRINRAVLLIIMALAMLLPWCNVSWMSLDDMPVIQAAHRQMIEVGIPIQIGFEDETIDSASHTEGVSLSWFDIVAFVYFAGMALSIMIRCAQVGLLSHMLHHNNVWTKRNEQGIRICCRKGHFTPYSWMNTIVISEEDWNEGIQEVMMHEMGHIIYRHSYDIIFLMICQAFQWYNPFVWMMGHSMSDIHEYEADDYVLRQGVEMRGYQMLLIKKAAGSSSYTFANSFKHSLTKKRITMMQNSNHNPWRRSRVLYVLPVAALALCAFATPKFMNPIEEAVQNLEDKGTANLQERQTISQENENAVAKVPTNETFTEIRPEVNNPDMEAQRDTTTYEKCDELPTYGEDENAMWQYFASHMKYPQSALENGIQGRICVEFVVEKDGTVTNVKANPTPGGEIQKKLNGLNELNVVGYNLKKETDANNDSIQAVNRQACQEILEEGERVVRSMGKWNPGKMKGKAVRARMTLPITFRFN